MNLRLSLSPAHSATVTLASGTVFEAASDQTILEAASRAGIWLSSACRIGVCGSCRGNGVKRRLPSHWVYARVIGHRTQRPHGTSLPRARDERPSDRNCRTARASAKRAPGGSCAGDRAGWASEQVMRLTLRFPPLDRPGFIPGQFVGIRHADGFDRSFSIANAPRADGTIELHVGRVSGGAFTGHVFEQLRLNDIIHVTGPFGNFTYAPQPRAAIFIAGGTGIAPVRAILVVHRRPPAPRTHLRLLGQPFPRRTLPRA